MNAKLRLACQGLCAAAVLLALTLLAPAAAPALHAQAGGSAIVIASFNQERPAVARNAADGSYLAVWSSVFASGQAINGRLLASDGTPTSNVLALSNETNACTEPDIAYNAHDNQYLVVWEYAFDAGANDYDVYAQRISNTGATLGGRITIANSGDHEGSPAVAYNSLTNEYLVVYTNEANGKIIGLRVAANGTFPAGAAILGVSPGLAGAGPDVAYSTASDLYLLVWYGYDGGGDYDVFGQRVHPLLPLLGSVLNLSDWTGQQRNPSLAYNPERDEFLVFWQDHHYDLSKAKIYGQRVHANGSLMGSSVVPANQSSVDNRNPAVAYVASAHGYLLVWENAQSTTNSDVYSLLYAGDAQPLSSLAVVSAGSSNEFMPAVAADPTGTVEIVWEDYRTLAVGADIYGTALPIQLQTLSGNVYAGTKPDTSAPLSGVTVNLGCSNAAADVGTIINTSTTNAGGAFNLPVFAGCEYYHLVQTVPAGYAASEPVTIGGTQVSNTWIRYTQPLADKVLTGNGFWDYLLQEVDKVPQGDVALQLHVAASANLASAPQVQLWQEGASDALNVSMAFDGSLGAYTGQVAQPAGRERRGNIRVAATDTAGHTIITFVDYTVTPVVAAAPFADVYSSDNNFELVIPAGALDGEPLISIQPASPGGAPADNLVRVGQAYQVIVSSGQTHLNLPAVANMHYKSGVVSGVAQDSVRLYRWDAQTGTWVTDDVATLNTTVDGLSAQVTELTTFALFGRSENARDLYLPIIGR